VTLLCASTLVRPLLDGDVRPLRAVDRSSGAWQLSDESGRVVACLGAAPGWRLPYAFVLDALPAADVELCVGAGALTIDGRRLQPRRWWRPARPLVASLRPLPAAVDVLAARWRDDLGRGPGLTPYADDVLCGGLVALAASGTGSRLRAAVAAYDLERRTTAVSAALLRLACDGWCIDEVAGYLGALDAQARRRPGHGLGDRRRRLLAVGHSSGTGLLQGVDAVLGVQPSEDAA
jgi:uncharacterized protein DUF2877